MSGTRTCLRYFAFCALALGACAAGTPPADDDDDTPGNTDAPGGNTDGPDIDGPGPNIDGPGPNIDAPNIDAPNIDAPSTQMITLSQSSSQAITALNTVACYNATLGYTDENSFYRVFRLADHGVNTAFTATRVDFAIEEATADAGSQTLQVRVHTLNGAFVRANLTTIAGQTVTVPNQTLTNMSVTLSPPGVAPAGSTIVLELFSPSGTTVGHAFFPGSNAAAETGPSYIRAPGTGCAITEPATYASISNPQVHLVMSVTGTY